MSTLGDMIDMASGARERAYAPYSGFAVGACVRADTGACYAGCNVENAAYPESQCAEANAIGAMVAGGDTRIVEVVVVGGGDEPCTPCGGCRQKLGEFAGPDTPVHICGPGGVRQTVTLGDLLPFAFGPANLEA